MKALSKQIVPSPFRRSESLENLMKTIHLISQYYLAKLLEGNFVKSIYNKKKMTSIIERSKTREKKQD